MPSHVLIDFRIDSFRCMLSAKSCQHSSFSSIGLSYWEAVARIGEIGGRLVFALAFFMPECNLGLISRLSSFWNSNVAIGLRGFLMVSS